MRISWLSLVALATLPSARADGPPAVHPAPMPPLQAAGRMTLPEGFRATLFAAEPDVRQPIAMATDERGRLWVAENFSYPGWLQPAREKDRILILEDQRRRRPPRPPDGLLGPGDHRLGAGPGVRRGVRRRHAEPPVHPRPRRRRRARRPGRGGPRRLGREGPAQPVQRPELGARRLALRLQRDPVQLAGRPPRHPRRGPGGDQLRGLARTTRRPGPSRPWPTGPPTPGGSTSTTSARCSSPTA